MASSLSTAITSLLLNPYANYPAPMGQSTRPTGDAIKPAGTNNSARALLEADGALALRQVRVDAVADSTSEQARRQQQANQYRQPSSFADFARPKATLGPADEMALFASVLEDVGGAGVTAAVPLSAAPRTANGAGITDITPDEDASARTTMQSLAEQRQANAAGLYARNADITFNIDPVYSQAA